MFELNRMPGHGMYALGTLWTAHEGCWEVTLLLADWPRYGLCLASLIANFRVLFHHFREAPHPKFLIHCRRRIFIRMHIACGVCEMLFAVGAFGTCRPLLSLAACIFCIGHVSTSYYLMTGLFGIRNIMTPCYGFAVTIHAVNGVRLFLEPSSIPKLVDMFLTLSIYVWVRIMYAFIDRFATMARYQYTVSVLVAGLIIVPSLSVAGGLMANLFIIAAIAVWNMIYPVLPPCCKHAYPGRTEDGDYKMDKVELSRSAFGADIHTYARLTTFTRNTPTKPSLRLPSSPDRTEDSGESTKKSLRFEPHLSEISGVRTRLTYYEAVGEQSDHVDVHEEMPFGHHGSLSRLNGSASDAELDPEVRDMFAKLCEDADAGMTREDMEKLLAVWGLPYKEAEYVFAELRPNLSNPDFISFDEFYKLLKPVWRYTLDVVASEAETEVKCAVGKTNSVNDYI